jgi:hypothetical protein
MVSWQHGAECEGIFQLSFLNICFVSKYALFLIGDNSFLLSPEVHAHFVANKHPRTHR